MYLKSLLLCLLLGCATGISAQQLTLDECIRLALENNFDLQITENDRRVAENNATPAAAALLPTIDATANYNGSYRDFFKQKNQHAFANPYDAGVYLNYDIFSGFANQNTYRKLKTQRLMADLTFRMESENLIAELSAEYYTLLQETRKLENYNFGVQLSQERLRIVEERFNIGSASRLDTEQARVDLNADKSILMLQTEVIARAQTNINRLISPRNWFEHLQTATHEIEIDTLLKKENLLTQMLEKNTAILLAKQRISLSEYDKKIINARTYPYLRLTSGVLYDGEIGKPVEQSLGVNYGLTLGINLFGKNNRKNIANANIALETARLEADNVEQDVRAELEIIYVAYANKLKLLQMELDNLESAQMNYDIAFERYKLGELSGIVLREAQKSLLDATDRMLNIEYEAKIAELSLKQISGNMFYQMIGLPKEPQNN
jgi:outer membrane protein TolC